MPDRAGRGSLGGYPPGGEGGGGRVRADFLRVAAPGDNLQKSFKERGLRGGGRLGRYEQVEGRAGARVCPGGSSCRLSGVPGIPVSLEGVSGDLAW